MLGRLYGFVGKKEGGSKILNMLRTYLVKATYRSTRIKLLLPVNTLLLLPCKTTWKENLACCIIYRREVFSSTSQPKIAIINNSFPRVAQVSSKRGSSKLLQLSGKKEIPGEKSRAILPNDPTNGFRSIVFPPPPPLQTCNFYEQIIHSSLPCVTTTLKVCEEQVWQKWMPHEMSREV